MNIMLQKISMPTALLVKPSSYNLLAFPTSTLEEEEPMTSLVQMLLCLKSQKFLPQRQFLQKMIIKKYYRFNQIKQIQKLKDSKLPYLK